MRRARLALQMWCAATPGELAFVDAPRADRAVAVARYVPELTSTPYWGGTPMIRNPHWYRKTPERFWQDVFVEESALNCAQGKKWGSRCCRN